jgi:hypothetical protein
MVIKNNNRLSNQCSKDQFAKNFYHKGVLREILKVLLARNLGLLEEIIVNKTEILS